MPAPWASRAQPKSEQEPLAPKERPYPPNSPGGFPSGAPVGNQFSAGQESFTGGRQNYNQGPGQTPAVPAKQSGGPMANQPAQRQNTYAQRPILSPPPQTPPYSEQGQNFNTPQQNYAQQGLPKGQQQFDFTPQMREQPQQQQRFGGQVTALGGGQSYGPPQNQDFNQNGRPNIDLQTNPRSPPAQGIRSPTQEQQRYEPQRGDDYYNPKSVQAPGLFTNEYLPQSQPNYRQNPAKRRPFARDFTMDDLRQSDGVLRLQSGTNQFASQRGMTGFGTPRNTETKLVQSNPQLQPVHLQEQDNNTRVGRWTIGQLRATDAIIPLQNGTNRFDSQRGMTGFGAPRDVRGRHVHRLWEDEADYQYERYGINAVQQ